jgi:hypothetical protein
VDEAGLVREASLEDIVIDRDYTGNGSDDDTKHGRPLSPGLDSGWRAVL